MAQKSIFIKLAKVDEEKREVTGVLACEEPDRDGEIFDYASSVPFFRAWNEDFSKTTGGASVGNVREMHGLTAAGKFISMDYDDAARRITTTAKIVDDSTWAKIAAGVLTGFSIGGDYVGAKKAEGKYKRYTAKPIEGSVVDYPCMPGAVFEAIKADGTIELRKLTGGAMEKGEKTKRVDGVDLKAESFAYVGDASETDTWKLPINFPGDEEKTKSHIRNALARFDQTEGIPEGEKEKVKAKIESAAKEHGIDVAEKAARREELRKGMCTVADLAWTLDQLDYIRQQTDWEAEVEGDDSPLGEQLRAAVGLIGRILQAMVAEETQEMSGEQPDFSEETLKMVNGISGLLKRNRSLKEHLDNAKEAHAKMGEHLDKLGKAIGAEEGGESNREGEPIKTATNGTLDKAADARIAGLEKAVEGIGSVLAEMAKTVAAMAGQPLAPAAAANGAAVSVTKVADGAVPDAKTEPAIDPKDPEAAQKAIKAAHRNPQVLGHTAR